MKFLFYLIISFSIHLYSYAILPTQFYFRHYNIEDGVSSNNISSIIQDEKGYIWIGTDNGLNRFDGIRFIHFKKGDPHYPSFQANNISTIYEMNSEELWIGTEHGVYIYNQRSDKFSFFNIETSNKVSIKSWVSDIIQDKKK